MYMYVENERKRKREGLRKEHVNAFERKIVGNLRE